MSLNSYLECLKPKLTLIIKPIYKRRCIYNMFIRNNRIKIKKHPKNLLKYIPNLKLIFKKL